MGNDLKQRLEALSAGANTATWEVTVSPDTSLFIQPHGSPNILLHEGGQETKWCDTHFIVALVNAFRSGDLVTRSEMEEAVAKERESCAKVACFIGDMHPDEDHSYHIGELIRARSEQKEGE